MPNLLLAFENPEHCEHVRHIIMTAQASGQQIQGVRAANLLSRLVNNCVVYGPMPGPNDQPSPAPRPTHTPNDCEHNQMVRTDSPDHVWECAVCGYVYGLNPKSKPALTLTFQRQEDFDRVAKYQENEAKLPALVESAKSLLAIVRLQNGNLHEDTNKIQADAVAAIEAFNAPEEKP